MCCGASSCCASWASPLRRSVGCRRGRRPSATGCAATWSPWSGSGGTWTRRRPYFKSVPVALDEAARLCTLLKEREIPLRELDAEGVLEEMEKLEQTGTTFQNKQRQDVRIRYVAPVVITAALVVPLAALAAVMLWRFCINPANAPPLAVLMVMEAVPLLMIAGVLLALFQRIKEIGRGEIDDAKQY